MKEEVSLSVDVGDRLEDLVILSGKDGSSVFEYVGGGSGGVVALLVRMIQFLWDGVEEAWKRNNLEGD